MSVIVKTLKTSTKRRQHARHWLKNRLATKARHLVAGIYPKHDTREEEIEWQERTRLDIIFHIYDYGYVEEFIENGILQQLNAEEMIEQLNKFEELVFEGTKGIPKSELFERECNVINDQLEKRGRSSEIRTVAQWDEYFRNIKKPFLFAILDVLNGGEK